MAPGDIVFWRDSQFQRHRFWLIQSVLLGAEGHESLVTIRSLNFEPGHNEDGLPQPWLIVPEVLLRGMVYSRTGVPT